MSRYVNADELEKEIIRNEKDVNTGNREINIGYGLAHKHIINLLKYIPTTDVEPVRHAHWIIKGTQYGTDFLCSACDCYNECEYATLYCPNCGAKMDEEVKQ